jgi:hypothetical protein
MASATQAQYAINWHAHTCGGNTTPIGAGAYTLVSAIGAASPQGTVSGGSYSLVSGFLAGAETGSAACYANCDGSTTPPVLNVADFTCFLTKFAGGDGYANCDQSTTAPVLNVADFSCFLTKFATGCP